MTEAGKVFSSSYQSYRALVAVWVAIAFLIGSWSLWLAKPITQRSMYSDVATHVMIASSVWHDLDLKYSLEDLARFRMDYPAENGPRGLFLKEVPSGELIYAKPYLYGGAAAVFYGWLGVNGFIILNSICLLVIGLVSTLSLRSAFGTTWGLFITIGFVLPSPFMAWVAVPHPDLFIAALLAGGSYLLVRGDTSTSWRTMVGTAVLAAAIHDKPTFVVLLPFLLLAIPGPRSFKKFAFILGVIASLWLGLSLPNLLADGTLYSYQGARFYSGGPLFPLEEGWVPPANKGITGKIFNPLMIATTLLGNLTILPSKLVDFIIGRQTGILVYFPVALLALIYGIFSGLGRGLWLFAGFFAYLALNWLAFPTNGYGGMGTYGPRYMMQVLPIIPLAYLGVQGRTRSIIALPWKLMFIAATVASMALHYRAFVLGDDLVRLHSRWFLEHPLNRFPVEDWLLPATGRALPTAFEKLPNRKTILINKTLLESQVIALGTPSAHFEERILFHFGEDRPAGDLALWSKIDQKVTATNGLSTLGQFSLTGWQPLIINFDQLNFDNLAFDLLTRNFVRFAKIEALALNDADNVETGPVFINLARDYQPFQDYDRELTVTELESAGVALQQGWSHLEPWGVWSDGHTSHLLLQANEATRAYEVVLNLQSYVPPEDPVRNVRLLVNNRLLGELQFTQGEGAKEVRYPFKLQPEEKFINLGLEILNPVSPKMLSLSDDNRLLGVGLKGFRLNRVTEHEK